MSDASASLVPPLCFLLPTNSAFWAIIVATTVPPFGDHGNPWATMAMVLPPLCLLCTTCCATTTVVVVQGTYKGRAAAVTQKQNFLGLGDHWASWLIFWSLKGGTKAVALCKWGLMVPYKKVMSVDIRLFSINCALHLVLFSQSIYYAFIGVRIVYSTYIYHVYMYIYIHILWNDSSILTNCVYIEVVVLSLAQRTKAIARLSFFRCTL